MKKAAKHSGINLQESDKLQRYQKTSGLDGGERNSRETTTPVANIE